MIKIENVDVVGWQHAIRGMRNPKNSWDKSDSFNCNDFGCLSCPIFEDGTVCDYQNKFYVGDNDLSLMQKLSNAGSDHGKFLRMIVVYADIVAPLYWFKEFDTYKVGTVANSCSTMHKLTHKPFELDDFSHDKLSPIPKGTLGCIVDTLNALRNLYLNAHTDADKKQAWWDMIQLLPSSYNQKRTLLLNYQVLKNMYHARRNHKLDEWREFCKWIESLPYSELITGGKS